MTRVLLLLALALSSAPAHSRNIAAVYWGGYCVNGNGFCVFMYNDGGAVRMIDPFENRTSIDDNTDDGSMILHDWTDGDGNTMTAVDNGTTIDFSNGLQWAGTKTLGDAFQSSRCGTGLGICVVFASNGMVTGVLTEAREYSDATYYQINGVYHITATRWNKTAKLYYDADNVLSTVEWQNGALWTR